MIALADNANDDKLIAIFIDCLIQILIGAGNGSLDEKVRTMDDT